MSSIQNQNGNLTGTLKPQGVLKGKISKSVTYSHLNFTLENRLDGNTETDFSLEENVYHAISDFNEIEKALREALAESSVEIPEGADTSTYANYIKLLAYSSKETVAILGVGVLGKMVLGKKG